MKRFISLFIIFTMFFMCMPASAAVKKKIRRGSHSTVIMPYWGTPYYYPSSYHLNVTTPTGSATYSNTVIYPNNTIIYTNTMPPVNLVPQAKPAPVYSAQPIGTYNKYYGTSSN